MTDFRSDGFPIHRGRRLRKNKNIRELVAEIKISKKDLVMPYFIIEDDEKSFQVNNMPGIKRFKIDELMFEIEHSLNLGISAIALLPKIRQSQKSQNGSECLNEKNLICKALKKIKSKFPDLVVICDVALDAYTLSGHDGVLDKSGYVDNDKTIEILSKMATLLASHGCDVVAPSDMMDGRVRAIRNSLEKAKMSNTCILSYSSKFASNFYSPFRDALGSKKNLGDSSKSSYQIDFRNFNEAIKETLEDIQEGADIVMVKPAMYYLDIINEIKTKSLVPVAAFQVSGEYSMIKIAAENNYLDLKNCVFESLACIKRAGADIIFSYFSNDVATWLTE